MPRPRTLHIIQVERDVGSQLEVLQDLGVGRSLPVGGFTWTSTRQLVKSINTRLAKHVVTVSTSQDNPQSELRTLH